MDAPDRIDVIEPLTVEASLRRLAHGLPGAVRYRLLNTLEHFERASSLFDIDREMASFRAITGEEEGATALMIAIRLRKYPAAKKFNPRNHLHKAGVVACIKAMEMALAPMLAEFQMTFDFQKTRIDLQIPLSIFGVPGDYAVQPVEPLDLVQASQDGNLSEVEMYESALGKFADKANVESIKRLVEVEANARNTLLYASDSAIPRSKATKQALEIRKRRALTMLCLAVMVLQSEGHQALVKAAIGAFQRVILRLPADVDQ